jgi:ribonucleoside-diphosphate reductase alpha chain
MYLYAWKAGLKTTYYLRSRPATRIQQTTISAARAVVPDPVSGAVTGAVADTLSDPGAVTCSLENPDTCEACE